MQPGQPVYRAIVDAFGPEVVRSDGQLDRTKLAQVAFAGGKIQSLNQIIHPEVVNLQEAEFARLAEAGHALAVVESALIFEASGSKAALTPGAPTVPGWRERFDRLVLVTASDPVRLERFVNRMAAPDAPEEIRDQIRLDGQRRMKAQIADDWKRSQCQYIIDNDESLVLLRREALRVLHALQEEAKATL